MGPYNKLTSNSDSYNAFEIYTVTSMDYVFDESIRMGLCFAITKQKGPNLKLILNVI